MESATKNKQTKDQIIRMVQKTFNENLKPKDIKIKELTDGYFNVAYEIGLPEKEVILKIAPQPSAQIMTYENNIMKAEVEGLKLVREKTLVPVPEVYSYDTSISICNAAYFFMEKIHGDSFHQLKCKGMIQEEQDQIYREVGRLNREINQITGTRFGYLGQPEEQGISWKDTFLSMVWDILEDGQRVGVELGVEYDTVRNLYERAGSILEEIIQPDLVHWDIWEGNVFVKDGKVTGIIDFERAIWGDPLMEYSFRNHSRQEKFLEGYGVDLRSKAPVRALLYDIYLYLILIIETKYRLYPDDGQYNFAVGELDKVVKELNKVL